MRFGLFRTIVEQVVIGPALHAQLGSFPRLLSTLPFVTNHVCSVAPDGYTEGPPVESVSSRTFREWVVVNLSEEGLQEPFDVVGSRDCQGYAGRLTRRFSASP